jgi:hypothetical protein
VKQFKQTRLSFAPRIPAALAPAPTVNAPLATTTVNPTVDPIIPTIPKPIEKSVIDPILPKKRVVRSTPAEDSNLSDSTALPKLLSVPGVTEFSINSEKRAELSIDSIVKLQVILVAYMSRQFPISSFYSPPC